MPRSDTHTSSIPQSCHPRNMSHSELENKYENKTSGKVVFFSPHAMRSFYFEFSALTQEWDFSYDDGVAEGRDGESLRVQ